MVKHFSKSKSHSLIAAHDQKTFVAQKKIVHMVIFTLIRFQVKTPSERIVLPVKKNLKKTNAPLRAIKIKRRPKLAPAIARRLLKTLMCSL